MFYIYFFNSYLIYIESLRSSSYLFTTNAVFLYNFPPPFQSVRKDALSLHFSTESQNAVLVYVGSAMVRKRKDFLQLSIVRKLFASSVCVCVFFLKSGCFFGFVWHGGCRLQLVFFSFRFHFLQSYILCFCSIFQFPVTDIS